MRKIYFVAFFLFAVLSNTLSSQVTLHTQNFEGPDLIGYVIGNATTNTDYTTQAFATSPDGTDFFRRDVAASFPFLTPVTGNDTAMVAGEDLSFTTGPVFDGHSYLRLNPITITGKTNLTIDIDVAFPNNTSIRYEDTKFLIVEYRLNGTGSYTQALAFYGNGLTSGLFRDTNLNGIIEGGETTNVTNAMTTFSVDLNTIAGSSVIGTSIDIRVRINMPDPQEEFAFDNIILKGIDSCTNPTVPTVTATANPVCSGGSTTLNIAGTLNDATQWVIYTGSCGGTLVGTTTTSTFNTGTLSANTTYFVRGEGACVTPGSCGSLTVNTTARDNASFSYAAAAYCVNDADPTPTISGVSGGTFSSTSGLSINAATGIIDVSASTPRTYSVTYTTAGSCPNSSSVNVTINALDNAGFSYAASDYNTNGTDPTPTIFGTTGGTFSSTTGLVINTSTGTIDVSASTPGLYAVTYTTAGSCTTSSSTVSVRIIGPLSASIASQTNIACRGGSNGRAAVSATGGTAPYTYLWSTGATTASIAGVIAGTYNVRVTDANSLTSSTSVTITEPSSALTAFISAQTNVACRGGSTGEATVTVSGGTPSYTYSWAPSGGTAATATGLAAGAYNVTITDANGCSVNASVTITQPSSALVATATLVNNVSSPGARDGAATASATGGVAPYRYQWSDGSITANLTNVPSGTYTVFITDANNCLATASVTITSFSASIASQTNIACRGGSNGRAAVSATGGTAPYTYLWSTGATTASIAGVIAGTYNVTVTDANALTSTASVTITEPSSTVTAFISAATNVSCNGGSDGSATAGASGGTAPYTYNWSNGRSTATITNIPAGFYNVIVTDANGCTNTSTVNVIITEPTVLIATAITENNASCNGFANGAATASATGGTAPYTYSWSNGATTASITGVVAGTYNVRITDANGCTDTASTIITEPTRVDASFNYSAASYCVNDTDPTPTITGTNGGTFSSATGLSINGVTGIIDVSASTPGIYTVTYTTAGSCASETFNVEILNVPVATFTAPADLCIDAGTQNGLSGGNLTAANTVQWTFSNLAFDNGDTVTGSFTYNTLTEAYVDWNISIEGTGGFTPETYTMANSSNVFSNRNIFTFEKQGGNYFTGTFNSPLNNTGGNITLRFIDHNQSSFTFRAPTFLGAVNGIPLSTTNIYSGPGVTDNGDGMTFSFDPAVAGVGVHTITYTVTNSNGCSNSATDTIEVFDLDNASFSYNAASYCVDGSDPTPTITGLAGGTFSSTTGLSITPTDGSIHLPASMPGTYTVTYTTTGTCPNSSTVTVVINASPTVSFTAPADLCVDAGIQNGLSGGTPQPVSLRAFVLDGVTFADGGVATGSGIFDTTNNTLNDWSISVSGGNTSNFPNLIYTPTNSSVSSASLNSFILNVNQGSRQFRIRFEVAFVNSVGSTIIDSNFPDFNVECYNCGTFRYINAGSATVTDISTTGVYSGPGVTDGGNGTYSFDPATAGVGTHTITYTVTNANGCTNAATDTIEVFDLPTVTFTAPADLCIDAGTQNGLSGGNPISANTVQWTLDNVAFNNGDMVTGSFTYDFSTAEYVDWNISIAGTGVFAPDTYTMANSRVDTQISDTNLFALRNTLGNDFAISFSTRLNNLGGNINLVNIVQNFNINVRTASDSGAINGVSAATINVYSGPGVTDNGDGMTYSFDPAAAGVGIHTITYTVTNSNGCSNSATDTIEVLQVTRFDAVTAVNVVGSYTLPTITGTNLSGNEKYYTEINGGGTAFAKADILQFTDFTNYPVTLYLYDTSVPCSNQESFELTITSPIQTGLVFAANSFTYDGTVKSLVVTGQATDAMVTYENNGQTNAGTYTVKATVTRPNYTTAVLEAVLTINKATATITAVATQTVTYDGTVKNVSATLNHLETALSYTPQQGYTNVGTYVITVNAAETTNYLAASQSVNLVIEPATQVGLLFAANSFTYDGTVKSLVVTGQATDAMVTYENNGQTNAGTYTVKATVTRPNFITAVLEAVLTINKAAQTITFNPLLTRSLENDPDFQLGAAASSGLAVSYAYTFSSAQPAAIVSTSGFVTLETSGQIQITATQSGNANYLAATAVQQTLTVNSSNAQASRITVNGQAFNNPTAQVYYLIDCDNSTNAVAVTIAGETNAQVSTGLGFNIATPVPGIYRQPVVITSQDGSQSTTYMVVVEKRFDFDAIVEQKFNNVLVVNNNFANNGGYRFVAYEWFKNGNRVGTEQAFSEGDNRTDRLDPTAAYYVRMTTQNGDVLQTCISSISLGNTFSLTVLENPVISGKNLKVRADFPAAELEKAVFHLYTTDGRLVFTTPVQGIENAISISEDMPVGLYRLVLSTNQRSKSVNFIKN